MPASPLDFVYTVRDRSGAQIPWGPKVGGPLLSAQPSHTGVLVPTIFGSNGFEGSIFVLEDFGVTGLLKLNSTVYLDFLDVNFGDLASAVAQQYPLSVFDNSVFAAMSIIMRDFTFRCPAYRGASLAASKGLPVWTYSYNQTTSCPPDVGVPTSVLPLIAAGHGTELQYVWGQVMDLPQPDGNCSLTAGERAISAYMVDAWTNMAKSATPGGKWPPFRPDTTQGINFQDGIVRPGAVDYSMCAFWDEIAAEILKAAAGNMTTVTYDGNNTAAPVAPYTGAATSLDVPPLYSVAVLALLAIGTASGLR